ncbi:hypothetical protein SBADM41S_00122 [Streptomyces badius]
MYVSWPPMSYDSASHSTVVGVAVVVEPSVVYVRKSSALSVAISPSSSVTTWRVWATRAATSEATNISFSPMPRTTGEPLRATTMRSLKSACSTAMP